MVDRTVYGSSEVGNLRGQVVERWDQAGVARSEAFDFKGNLLSGHRQLSALYDRTLNWREDTVPASAERWSSSTRYDAMNRPIQAVSPDNSVLEPTYNEAGL
ncbi:MAG: hypothetical protein IPN01_35380, partial [Deltaproteobacteria bacterium]|nr:hypothetical protein [Deltaproteobacteria bacterium]